MREIRQSGSEGGAAELNRPSLPLSMGGNLNRYHHHVGIVLDRQNGH